MVHVAREDEPVHERRVEEQLLEPFQRPEPDQIAAADADQIPADVKMPVLLCGVDVADDLDLTRIAGAKAVLVREADVVERHRIETHHLRRHRVDRDLIGGRQHHVLHHRIHRPRTGSVACGRAVHDREQSRVNFLLDGEQVHQCFVDPGVRVMAACVQQTAEGILHRPGRGRVDVALGRRQMDDVLAEEKVGNVDAFREDAIEDAHPRLRLVAHPRHVLVLEVVADRDLVPLEDRHVVVQVFALERVGDDGLVLDADLIGVAAPRERLNGAFELPRRGVRAGKRKVPRDVVLQNRRLAGRERARDAAELYDAIDIREDVVRRDPEDSDCRFHDPCRPGCRPGATTESPAYCCTIDRRPV